MNVEEEEHRQEAKLKSIRGHEGTWNYEKREDEEQRLDNYKWRIKGSSLLGYFVNLVVLSMGLILNILNIIYYFPGSYHCISVLFHLSKFIGKERKYKCIF